MLMCLLANCPFITGASVIADLTLPAVVSSVTIAAGFYARQKGGILPVTSFTVGLYSCRLVVFLSPAL